MQPGEKQITKACQNSLRSAAMWCSMACQPTVRDVFKESSSGVGNLSCSEEGDSEGLMELPENLVSAIKRKQVILFAGAGLSSHLGLPLFNVLKSHLGEQLGLRNWHELDFPELAEYYLLQTENPQELWTWMRSTWHPGEIDVLASHPHRCIVDLGFPVIYTTNYDSWLEETFQRAGKPFRKIVDVANLAETRTGETEIIKFHGDFDNPDTIVLAESSFLRRMSLDEPLDIRLRADSLAKPILFIGYSMRDPNIRYLLFKLRQLWQLTATTSKKPTSYLLLSDGNEVQQCLLRQRGIEPILTPSPDVNTGLRCFFRSLAAAVKQD
jgi:hypothetical protein